MDNAGWIVGPGAKAQSGERVRFLRRRVTLIYADYFDKPKQGRMTVYRRGEALSTIASPGAQDALSHSPVALWPDRTVSHSPLSISVPMAKHLKTQFLMAHYSPDEARQLTGHRRCRHVGMLARSLLEFVITAMQSAVRTVGDGDHRFGLPRPSLSQHDAHRRSVAIVLGRFHQNAPDVGVARLGDAAPGGAVPSDKWRISSSEFLSHSVFEIPRWHSRTDNTTCIARDAGFV